MPIQRLADGQLQRLTYYNQMLYVLRVRIGDVFEDLMRVQCYRKPQLDEAHGLWTVKRDGLVSDKWRPFVQMGDVLGQVFYGDDPREPSIRVVLEKAPGPKSNLSKAGDEDDLLAAAAIEELNPASQFGGSDAQSTKNQKSFCKTSKDAKDTDGKRRVKKRPSCTKGGRTEERRLGATSCKAGTEK